MRHIIDAIAAQGRDGDTELLHVTKGEMAGLDALSRRYLGRETPRNPKTGLREASWLQAVLPAAVGLGAGIITMNPVVGAAAGAAAGAGTSAAEGGTTEQALMSGVMGGIAGYGAAGIGAGLANAGAATAAAGTETGAGLVAEGSSAALPTTATGTAETVASTAAPTATTGTTAATGNTAATGTLNVANAPTTTGETLSNTNLLAQPKSGAGLTMPQGGVTSLGGQTGPVTSVGGGSGVTAPSIQGSAPTLTGAPSATGPNWSSLASKEGLSNLSTAGIGAMGGASLVNGQPAAIAEPGKQSTENPYEGELYYGPEGELRSRAVLKAAEGGMMYGDYDAVDAQPDGGYAPGGLASFADGGDVKGDFNAKDVGTYMDEQGGLGSLTPEEAKAARMMRLARYLGPNRRPEGYADGGGIGMVRAMQPGGAWGGATADLYGVVDKNAPWLTKIQPGGFMGALQPGRMDYEDRKRQEAADKEAQAQEQAAAIQKAKQVAQLEALRTNVPQMAGGGIASFGKGRYLQGPGDGMSDSIPADIDGKRPARLATGEFVVPADVVSGLGNGDSTSGAKQLHSMMDRVRMARTGTKKQGKQINPNKVMPV